MSKHPLLHDFPLVRDQERDLRRRARAKAAELQLAMQQCEQVALLAGDQRFKLWIAIVQKMLDSAQAELLAAVDAHTLARAQGRVLGLQAIVAITSVSEAQRKDLAQRLKEEHDLAVALDLNGEGPINPGKAIWSDHGRHEQRVEGQRSNPGERP